MTSTTSSGEDASNFAAFLATTRPKSARELGEELQRLVGRVIDTGKAGSLTYTLKVSPVDGGTEVLAVNDADGQTRLQYKKTVEARAGARGDLEIPTKLRLALKPYIGGPTYAVEAHFRYRIVGPALKLGYVLDRPDVILESAFGDVVEALREGQEATATRPAIEAITAPLYFGRP